MRAYVSPSSAEEPLPYSTYLQSEERNNFQATARQIQKGSMEKLLLSPFLVRALDSGETYHYYCLQVTHGFVDGVGWRLVRGADRSLYLTIEPLTRPICFQAHCLPSNACPIILIRVRPLRPL